MVQVAVAGASGTVGSSIIRAIAATSKHTVIALSRSENSALASLPGVSVKVVDYNDRTSLLTALNGCQVVISAVFSRSDEEGSLVHSQLQLLSAAHEAGVRRFAPSEFGILSESKTIVERMRLKQPVVEELQKIGMEYILFNHGIFMNYFCSGSKDELEGLAGLRSMPLLLNIPNGTAMIPGDGNQVFATTNLHAVARFVAASLDLEKWTPESGSMAGSKLTYNELVDKAEAVIGSQIARTFLPVAQLKEMATQPGETGFRGQVMLAHAMGYANVGTDMNRLCQDVVPTDIDAFLRRYWSSH